MQSKRKQKLRSPDVDTWSIKCWNRISSFSDRGITKQLQALSYVGDSHDSFQIKGINLVIRQDRRGMESFPQTHAPIQPTRSEYPDSSQYHSVMAWWHVVNGKRTGCIRQGIRLGPEYFRGLVRWIGNNRLTGKLMVVGLWSSFLRCAMQKRNPRLFAMKPLMTSN